MSNKHLQVAKDRALLNEMQARVKAELHLSPATFKSILFLKLALYLGASLTFYSLLFLLSSSLLFVLCYILLGLSLLLFAFNFAHDFSHDTIFKSKFWNNLGFISIYTLVGAHAEAWRERHVHSHHFAPNVLEYDSDLQITNIIRVTPEIGHRWYHRFQHLYAPLAYSSYSLYWIFIKDFVLLWEKAKSTGLSGQYLLSFIGQKVFYLSYLLIIPLLFVPQATTTILLGFLLMHLVQSVFLLFTFFMTHHVLETTYPPTNEEGIIQASWLMNQVQSSNDMHPFSWIANFFLGGFNNHIAHHLFPQIHHIYYPQLSRILYRVLEEYHIRPNQTTYLGGALSHLRLLQRLSRKKPGLS